MFITTNNHPPNPLNFQDASFKPSSKEPPGANNKKKLKKYWCAYGRPNALYLYVLGITFRVRDL
jgi:hypothetical protein